MKTFIQKLGMIVALLFSFLPTQAYDFEVDGIQYSIVSISDRTCEIEKVTENAGVEVSIPGFVTYKGNSFDYGSKRFKPVPRTGRAVQEKSPSSGFANRNE